MNPVVYPYVLTKNITSHANTPPRYSGGVVADTIKSLPIVITDIIYEYTRTTKESIAKQVLDEFKDGTYAYLDDDLSDSDDEDKYTYIQKPSYFKRRTIARRNGLDRWPIGKQWRTTRQFRQNREVLYSDDAFSSSDDE